MNKIYIKGIKPKNCVDCWYGIKYSEKSRPYECYIICVSYPNANNDCPLHSIAELTDPLEQRIRVLETALLNTCKSVCSSCGVHQSQNCKGKETCIKEIFNFKIQQAKKELES